MLGWIEKRRPRSYMPVGDVGDHEEKSSLRKYHRLFQITLCIGLTLISLGLGYFIRGDSGHLSHREIFEPFGNTRKTFQPNPVFMHYPSNASEATWESLSLSNGGFIKNPSNESAALGVSFYHQLHCLHMLQLQYFKTKHELAILRNNSVENTLIDTVGQQNVVHLEHCFDYMVQSILCAADTNLEPPDPILDETNGYGFERSCRDHKGIHNWMERHEYKT
ncbi:hypothetical protein HBI56_151710 [Parastagonospora nodorum]|uniref:Oxidase ustYa n=1 Tax=Phaeosphaeria nodorum (strain SN15 / ATCC MYA-4574 / FGSC 10173) TaxID=321614 RepID=A0A7U2FHA6_PHANO|nr:hypothetical protein HBH56_182800 [Parastagonospora nodorum]QRD04179.1 hypothetical protein JI435_129120 [Parastagonospora nodorum SN15]KAH3926203.1 hypothetical protein HBH54_171950 [Parastagonospora nodorum]KAH3962403.1 hypothetical protein HBH52_223450 [Parastagonospora nodorum]KAH3964877.1 hypothetical protein HBH51_154460 [Parastagonospora nodorum]